MEEKESIKQIIDRLPTKIVSKEGRNYYLTLKLVHEEVTKTTLKTYYCHPGTKHRVAETLFNIESVDVRDTIEKIFRELGLEGFMVINPIPDKVFRTSRPLMPTGEGE